jgi:hypothetical protein
MALDRSALLEVLGLQAVETLVPDAGTEGQPHDAAVALQRSGADLAGGDLVPASSRATRGPWGSGRRLARCGHALALPRAEPNRSARDRGAVMHH